MRLRARRLAPRLARYALVFALSSAPALAASSITFLHTAPPAARSKTALVIRGNVFGTGELDHAEVVFRTAQGAWRQVQLELEGADLWEARIPADEVKGDALYYYVQATDYFGDTRAIFASRAQPQRVPIDGATRFVPLPPEPGEQPAADAKTAGKQGDPKQAKTPDDGLGTRVTPAAPAIRSSRIEQWEPEGFDKKTTPATPAPARSALSADLQMFGADDTVSLASRHEQSVSEAPGIVSVVTGEQLRAMGLRTLADLMKTLPGFDTSRDVQGFWRVAARGRRVDPELLVLYDGHRLNNAYDGRVNWELPLDAVERVEVIRGPGSALYGTGAFNGVINVVPRRELGAAGGVTLGSFGTFGAYALGGTQVGRLKLFAGVDASTRTGYVKTIQRDTITTNPDQPAGETSDGRRAYGGNLHAEYDLGEGRPQLFGTLRVTNESRQALVGFWDVVGPGSTLGWMQTSGDLGLRHTAGGWSLKSRVYFDDHATDRRFVLYPQGFKLGRTDFPNGVVQETTASLWTTGLEASAAKEIASGHQATFGLQLERQSLADFDYRANVDLDQPTDLGNLVEPTGVVFPQKDEQYNRRVVAGVYAQDEWKLAEPLRLTAGLRGDFVSGFGFTSNPRLGLVYLPTSGVALKVLFARAFRAPTFDEFLSIQTMSPQLNTGQYVGFPRPGSSDSFLEPVGVTSLEAGGEWAGQLGEGRAEAKANAFWNGYDDPIEPVDSTGAPQLVNRPQGVRVVGAEVEGRYAWARKGGVTWANVSWFRARDLAVDESAPAFSLLTDVPQLRANWGLVLPLGSLFQLNLRATFGSERRNNARTTLEATRRFRIPAYGLFSAGVRTRKLWGHVEAAATVENLTDLAYLDDVPRPDQYRMPGLLPREGVSGFLTLRATY